MRRVLIAFILLGSIALSACAGMHAPMDCPMTEGVRCESLDHINAKVDQGIIGRETGQKTALLRPINKIGARVLDPGSEAPLRYGETVMRVWLSPFEDTAGNYHQESEVYTVVAPSYWIGSPQKAKDLEEK